MGLNLTKNLNGLKIIIKNWLGQIWAQAAKQGPWGGSGPKKKKKKNPINNQAGSQVLARGSGLGMQKPGPLPFLVNMLAIFCQALKHAILNIHSKKIKAPA